MTRNTFTKARIFLSKEVSRTFPIARKLKHNEATKGLEYAICYDDDKYYAPASGSEGEFTYGNLYTHFPTFNAAKEFFKTHKAEIAAAAEKRFYRKIACQKEKFSKFIFTKTTVDIKAIFHIYLDTMTGKEYYSIAEALKVCKNYLIVERSKSASITDPIDSDISMYTVERGKNYLLFEFYQFEQSCGRPCIKPHANNKPFRIYNNKKAFYCWYDVRTSKYVDAEEMYRDDSNLSRSVYYENGRLVRGYDFATDVSERYLEEGGYDHDFSNKTLKNIQDFGLPEYFFAGHDFEPEALDRIADLINYYLPKKNNLLYSPEETQICKDITNFLANIPFDKEHSVVKFRNGYILRLGAIVQGYKITKTRSDGSVKAAYLRPRPSIEDNTQNELVIEEYVEYARLFISNNFSTRSLSLASEGGRSWRHKGVHLVENLFQSNPQETHLDVDVEENNRAALIQLYTVHPKLKYMKKYMEEHPDVLYNSCIPFLRALFQYNMILETFIALKKDNIFWTPVVTEQKPYYHAYYYGWGVRNDNYTKKKETFSMDDFIETMELKNIPQKGDFYQRLGLTKQQFKLIFADTNRWQRIAKVLFSVNSIVFGGKPVSERLNFKLFSYETIRLTVEIINALLDEGKTDYVIVSEIDSLFEYYNSVKRVYKALITKRYDYNLLCDYLRMRQELIEDQFPDFKPSIWDMFPDDNEDLRRYHDRIMFIYNIFDSCKRSVGVLNDTAIINPLTSSHYTSQELYVHCKENEISVEEMHNLTVIANDISRYSSQMIRVREVLSILPTTSEALENKKEELIKQRELFQNLHYMYWGEDTPHVFRSYNEECRARERWGGQIYRDFLTAQLSNNLDKDKYDLYLRLRRKFIDNMEDFKVDNYPVQLNDEASLEKLYRDLAAQEPNLDQIIAQRERERRIRAQKEQEARVAEQQKKYNERYKKLKTLNYEDGSERCIVVPKNLISLIVEGQTLHHCVGSFVNSVSEGKDTIVFLRKVEDKDTPYVTISLQPDGKLWFIDQAHGDHNSDISEEDVEFLKGWASKKGIHLDSVKQKYGLNCHN